MNRLIVSKKTMITIYPMREFKKLLISFTSSGNMCDVNQLAKIQIHNCQNVLIKISIKQDHIYLKSRPPLLQQTVVSPWPRWIGTRTISCIFQGMIHHPRYYK